MSDIVWNLRNDVPCNGDIGCSYELCNQAADEIERLRTRLEIDPSHPYDGIYARDETIRGLEKQIESLRQKTQYWPDNAERDAVIRHQKEEIERLRSEGQKAAVEYLGQIGQLSDEITRLREWNVEIALNAREFAEALREIAKYEIEEGCPCNACQHSALARAALEHD